MATGAGKTFTAITNVYRLLKYGKAKRVLFLVDTKNLGEQAEISSRIFRFHYHRRMPPFDLQLVAAGFRLFRRFSYRFNRNARQTDFRFFQRKCGQRIHHEQALIDGVNVGREGTYLIETDISKKGNLILKQVVEKRERLSRRKRWEQLDEDVLYKPSRLDRDVVNLSQIRNIIRAFKEKVLTEMFPLRKEVPKTLVFAKTDSHAIDTVINTGWKEDIEQRAEETIHKFKQFIEENKSEITALNIIYSQAYRNRPLTLKMVEELYAAMQRTPYFFTVDKLWHAYSVKFSDKVKSLTAIKKLSDIVSIIRFELGYSKELDLYAAEVNLKFRDWMLMKNAGNIHFTEEQTQWLRMIRDHIAVSLSVTKDDLDLDPFGEQGGLGKFFQLFGNRYEEILEEMNGALAA